MSCTFVYFSLNLQLQWSNIIMLYLLWPSTDTRIWEHFLFPPEIDRTHTLYTSSENCVNAKQLVSVLPNEHWELISTKYIIITVKISCVTFIRNSASFFFFFFFRKQYNVMCTHLHIICIYSYMERSSRRKTSLIANVINIFVRFYSSAIWTFD